MPPAELSNDDLKRAQLPGPLAGWEQIQIFALTFDGHKRIGARLGELAQRHSEAGTVPADIDELRGCLFLEQRRWRHFGGKPDERAMRHIRALIEGLRAALEHLPVKW